MAAKGASRPRRRSSVFGGRDIAVDLGTANTIVFVRGRGIVLNEPSVVAVDSMTGNSLAVGQEAKRMIGRTPGNITAISPLKDGVIADFDICEKMLRHFINEVSQTRWPKPRMVICVPSGITGVEQRAVQEAAEYAGARRAYIIEEPMAAAIGAGLPVQTAQGSMIVDIGGGTTEVAVISLGGIVTARSVRIGGNLIDATISAHVKKEHGLIVGERTAEEIKLALGSAWPLQQEIFAEVRGRDMVSGLPESVSVDSMEIREAIAGPVSAIVDSVKATLDDTAPELAADVMDHGITLAGGGAMLRGLPDRLRSETGVAVHIAEDPLFAVVRGSGQTLEEFDVLHGVLYSSTEGR
ncbi:rod shape-determining protein [Candidatus Poriferisodalis sp.]|uniref:rod shape-determining protein n=1 Tax=Candidatus Poriferisodalis sp. TaxID=3101277 RepID=UPI003B51CD34